MVIVWFWHKFCVSIQIPQCAVFVFLIAVFRNVQKPKTGTLRGQNCDMSYSGKNKSNLLMSLQRDN